MEDLSIINRKRYPRQVLVGFVAPSGRQDRVSGLGKLHGLDKRIGPGRDFEHLCPVIGRGNLLVGTSQHGLADGSWVFVMRVVIGDDHHIIEFGDVTSRKRRLCRIPLALSTKDHNVSRLWSVALLASSVDRPDCLCKSVWVMRKVRHDRWILGDHLHTTGYGRFKRAVVWAF